MGNRDNLGDGKGLDLNCGSFEPVCSGDLMDSQPTCWSLKDLTREVAQGQKTLDFALNFIEGKFQDSKLKCPVIKLAKDRAIEIVKAAAGGSDVSEDLANAYNDNAEG